jgi:hypothetical protein
MSNEVYANGNEVSCKAAAGKSIAAFPDVCFTPPLTPATPPGVPIPYPNTGMASDTSGGSKTVQISGKEVMKKDSSYFKTSTGDEAGSAPKKNVITSKIKGKCYYTAWSMDVKVEGENVVRHLDLMTHNHASNPGATPPWVYADRMAMAENLKACEKENKAVEDNCEVDEEGNVKCPATGDADYYDDASMEKYARKIQNDPCQKAARCMLTAYENDGDDAPRRSCCKPQTPHHLIPKSSFFETSVGAGDNLPGCENYNLKSAPCICAEGGKTGATHGLLHDAQARELADLPADKPYNFGKASEIAAKNVQEIFPNSNCSEECIKAQLRRHGHKGMKNDTELKRKSEAPDSKADSVAAFKSSFRRTTRSGAGR